MIVARHGLSLLTSARRGLLLRLSLGVSAALRFAADAAEFRQAWCGAVRWHAVQCWHERWISATQQAGVHCPADCGVWPVLSGLCCRACVIARPCILARNVWLRTCTRYKQLQRKHRQLKAHSKTITESNEIGLQLERLSSGSLMTRVLRRF